MAIFPRITPKHPRTAPTTHLESLEPRTLLSLAVQDLSLVSAQQMAQTLSGSGLTITNPTWTGAPVAGGTFTGGNGIIGFDRGVLLSTGNIANVIGPNTSPNITTVNNTPGDAGLNLLIPGFTTQDAAFLEFDFTPVVSGKFSFQYVFASDEYNEFVNNSWNDVFGFFLNGKNVALLPDGVTPVSINHVNGGNPININATNPEYFINNDATVTNQLNTQMDGMTVVMRVNASVISGQTYHMKLAIADAGDANVDSAIFLKANSFMVIAGAQGINTTLSEGTLFAADVARFISDPSLAPGTIVGTIDYGDGSPLVEAVISTDNNGVYTVKAAGSPHAFTMAGTYTLTTTIGSAAPITSYVVVDNSTCGVFAYNNLRAKPGETFTLTMGEFWDCNPMVKASDFTVNINWADGYTSPATLVPYTDTLSNGVRFHVVATHTYDVNIHQGGVPFCINIMENATQVLLQSIGTMQIVYPAMVPMPVDPLSGNYIGLKDLQTGIEMLRLRPGGPNFSGTVRYATGDVNNDGYQDIVTTLGPGGTPVVKVYSGKDGSLFKTLTVFDASLRTGVFVASADVDGDHFADIIVGEDQGGEPRVRVFSGRTNAMIWDILAYDAKFTGGVRVAAGDIGDRGYADVVVAPGPSSKEVLPVKYLGWGGNAYYSYVPFDNAYGKYKGGVSVAVGDVYGDGRADVLITASTGSTGPSMVVNYKTNSDGNVGIDWVIYAAFDDTYKGPFFVTTTDYNLDGKLDIVLTTVKDNRNYIKVLEPLTGDVLYLFPVIN